MKRKHLLRSAAYWFNIGHLSKRTKAQAVFAMENAYNHLENSLAYILDHSAEAKAIFDRVTPNGDYAFNRRKLQCGDIVIIPGKNKIKGHVLKVIGTVAMVCPWNSGHEDIFPVDLLTVTGKRDDDVIVMSELDRNY